MADDTVFDLIEENDTAEDEDFEDSDEEILDFRSDEDTDDEVGYIRIIL